MKPVMSLFPDNLILAGYRGSIAHGMYVPSKDPGSIDDRDMMGVFVGPIEHYVGFGRKDTYEKFEGEWDVVSYEVVKFIRLLLKANPNVMSLLWLESNYYIYVTELGQHLIDNRSIFVSKKAYYSFTGYAYSQLKRMTSGSFEGYMGEKRKRLVEKYGYDTKNAAHLIRLLRMGIEFLADGVLHVERHDATQLLDIKRGEWTLEQVKSEADRLFVRAEEAHMTSKLPVEPNKVAAEALARNIVLEYHGYTKELPF